MRSLIALSLVGGLAAPAWARPDGNNDRPPPPSMMRSGCADAHARRRARRHDGADAREPAGAVAARRRPQADRAPTGAQRMDLPLKSDVAQKAHPGDSRDMAPKPQALDARAQSQKPATRSHGPRRSEAGAADQDRDPDEAGARRQSRFVDGAGGRQRGQAVERASSATATDDAARSRDALQDVGRLPAASARHRRRRRQDRVAARARYTPTSIGAAGTIPATISGRQQRQPPRHEQIRRLRPSPPRSTSDAPTIGRALERRPLIATPPRTTCGARQVEALERAESRCARARSTRRARAAQMHGPKSRRSSPVSSRSSRRAAAS